MSQAYLERALRPFGRIHGNEAATALLMFSYSFLAMTTYNIIQPVQRSLFIDKLGAVLIPMAQLTAGLVIGAIMAGYAWLMSRLPRRWAIPMTQGGIAVLCVVFWALFRTLPDHRWVAVGFYVFGLTLGILLISQFWTLANVVYDPRQAKRLFGFIGGGSSLGGALGAFISLWFASKVGTVNLLLVSAVCMMACTAVVALVSRREHLGDDAKLPGVVRKEGVGARRAIELLRGSRHLRLIAIIISLGAIGATVIDLQLSMATELFKKVLGKDAMTELLALVRFWTSIIGFVAQVLLTSRIHRYLGVGFALMLLPFSLGTSAAIMLINAALWAPMLARILDQSLRYTVDKTTREILYMPLSGEIKYEAKPFVDVTVDRFAKGLTAVLLLILILPSPWGLALGWQKLSYLSVSVTAIWFFMAVRARRGYQLAFRQSIEDQGMRPAEVAPIVADLSTVETLIQELARPEGGRVLYAMDMLESLDKRSLVTPLLLYHESPAVRIRALEMIGRTPSGETTRWLPAIRRMMADEEAEVRVAAVGALAHIRHEQATDLVRPYLKDSNARIAITAAMVLSQGGRADDLVAAEDMLRGLLADVREETAGTRREFALALRHTPHPPFRRLLIPLLSDPNHEVAAEAMRTVRHLGRADFIFVPTLISLLRSRRLRGDAREMLVGYGEEILGIMDHFMRDPEEDIRVRRHIPGTIARIPCQKSMNVLTGSLGETDALLRFQVLDAIEKLHRADPRLTVLRDLIETHVLQEGNRYLELRLRYRRLFEEEKLPKDSLLACAVSEKAAQALDRLYRLLGLIYPWKDIAAAQWAMQRGDNRSRAAALEYLDSLLAGELRKRVVAVLEEQSARPEPRGLLDDAQEPLRQLIRDPDPVLSAAAILFAGQVRRGILNEDLEKMLAARDVRDWSVFEAASWVSAAFRLQEPRRRALWAEPLPTVEVADRLRRLPLFSALSVDGLFRIARAGTQPSCEAGATLHQEGTIPETMRFLVDGLVIGKTIAGESREIREPAALAVREALEGRPMTETLRAGAAAACLTLGREEFQLLLADDPVLMQGLFRMWHYAGEGEGAPPVLQGVECEDASATAGPGLKPIEKALVLRRIPLFRHASTEEMPGLAAIAVEVPLESGAELFNAGSPPAIYLTLSGEIALDPPTGPPFHAGPGDIIGLHSTLAGIGLGIRASIKRDGTALRISRDDLFDLMAQRPELLRHLFAAATASGAPRDSGAGVGG